MLTATLHLRIQRDGRTRICKRCHAKIVFEGVKVGTAFLPAAKPAPVFQEVNRQVFKFEEKTVTMAELVPVAPKVELPKPEPAKPSGFRVVTRLVNGVLTNVRIPLDNP